MFFGHNVIDFMLFIGVLVVNETVFTTTSGTLIDQYAQLVGNIGQAELDEFDQIEHLMRRLKAYAQRKRQQA